MDAISLSEIRECQNRIAPFVFKTPVGRITSPFLNRFFGEDTKFFLKYELFQRTGTFKPRGALAKMTTLSNKEKVKGVIAVSAGNHAIAVAYAASVVGTHAKVIMPKNANPARLALVKQYGAEIQLVDNVHDAFEEVIKIAEKEGRAFIHPFEGPNVALGTGTLGMEWIEEIPELDCVIVPIGGGGLCAGVSSSIHLLSPSCKIFGVEPDGAKSMFLSLQSGKPMSIDRVNTIADSLGAPRAEPYSFELCQKHLEDVVTITDDEICAALHRVFTECKLAVEPAGAASMAAALGPLRSTIMGKRVGLLICGSNIDAATYQRLLQRGQALSQN